MSTRAQIVIMEDDNTVYPVKIYKHYDGYPEGVIPILAPFTLEFAQGRGADPEYFIAQCLGRFARADYGPGGANYTGWGLCTEYHGDIEYLYICYPNGRLTVIRPLLGRDGHDSVTTLPKGEDVTAEALEAPPAV